MAGHISPLLIVKKKGELHSDSLIVFCLSGPCIGLDTACSSSLVTTHLAANALADGEASSAVSAGINVMFSPVITAAICQLQVRIASSPFLC